MTLIEAATAVTRARVEYLSGRTLSDEDWAAVRSSAEIAATTAGLLAVPQIAALFAPTPTQEG